MQAKKVLNVVVDVTEIKLTVLDKRTKKETEYELGKNYPINVSKPPARGKIDLTDVFDQSR